MRIAVKISRSGVTRQCPVMGASKVFSHSKQFRHCGKASSGAVLGLSRPSGESSTGDPAFERLPRRCIGQGKGTQLLESSSQDLSGSFSCIRGKRCRTWEDPLPGQNLNKQSRRGCHDLACGLPAPFQSWRTTAREGTKHLARLRSRSSTFSACRDHHLAAALEANSPRSRERGQRLELGQDILLCYEGSVDKDGLESMCV